MSTEHFGDLHPAATKAVHAVCRRARTAARVLGAVDGTVKNAALLAMAGAVNEATAEVLAANQSDLARGRDAGLAVHLLDRLALDEQRLAAVADALRAVADLPDPIGDVVQGRRLPGGLSVRQTRVPLGVVAMVYEARPNVTVDAAGLALKSGNAAVLRGGSAAAATNAALVTALRSGLAAAGLPADAVQTIDELGRPGVHALMRARGLVDVLIPRGGADLIRTVVQDCTVPVIETGVGNCHVYVDAGADLPQALAVLLNSKTHRPGVCNSAETLLVHADAAAEFLPLALPALDTAGVRVHGDAATQRAGHDAQVEVLPATDEDWAAEYLSLDLAVAVVPDLDAALHHIQRWSSGHTEAICTRDLAAVDRFVAGVDAAAVAVNASTRFTDGEQLGMGAEIGISTQKLHARGPMGLLQLTTTTWLITGDGHIRH